MNQALQALFPALRRSIGQMRNECAHADCPNRGLLSRIPQARHGGVHFGGDWYCGAECFTAAARVRLAEIASRRVAQMPRSPRLSLGLVLLSKGFLTAEQLRSAMEQTQLTGEDVGSAAVRLGYVTEKQVNIAHAAQWGYPVFASERTVRPVEAELPRVLLEACSAVPLHYSLAARRILLGFATRVEHRLLDAVEQMTGCRAEACFITASDFDEQREQMTQPSGYEERVYEESNETVRMAQTLGRIAGEAGASHVLFAECKGYIWTRMTGKRGTTDLLFPLAAPVSAPRLVWEPELVSAVG